MAMFHLVLLFLLSALIFSRLWAVLGQRRFSEGSKRTVFLRKDQVKVEKLSSEEGLLYPGFDETKFLGDAEQLFQKVIFSYYRGDRDTLKKLTSPKVLAYFDHLPKATLDKVCVMSMKIVNQRASATKADVKVTFTSQQVLDDQVKTFTDIWTLSCAYKKEGAGWTLTDIVQSA
jgi:hypothetical protein